MTDLQKPNPDQIASIVQSLAKATLDSNTPESGEKWYEYSVYFEVDAWPEFAQQLVRQGYDWLALQELAKLQTPSSSTNLDSEEYKVLYRLIAELIEQTSPATILPYWDMLCAVAVRKWELEKQERGPAAESWAYASIMDGLWWGAREVPDKQMTAGVKLIWRGMGLKEVIGFQDIDKEMTELLDEAKKLDIAVPLDTQTCKLVLESTY